MYTTNAEKLNWRRGKVIWLLKKGDKKNPQNYRAISLLDTAYKIYARIINNRLKPLQKIYQRKSKWVLENVDQEQMEYSRYN